MKNFSQHILKKTQHVMHFHIQNIRTKYKMGLKFTKIDHLYVIRAKLETIRTLRYFSSPKFEHLKAISFKNYFLFTNCTIWINIINQRDSQL